MMGMECLERRKFLYDMYNNNFTREKYRSDEGGGRNGGRWRYMWEGIIGLYMVNCT